MAPLNAARPIPAKKNKSENYLSKSNNKKQFKRQKKLVIETFFFFDCMRNMDEISLKTQRLMVLFAKDEIR